MFGILFFIKLCKIFPIFGVEIQLNYYLFLEMYASQNFELETKVHQQKIEGKGDSVFVVSLQVVIIGDGAVGKTALMVQN